MLNQQHFEEATDLLSKMIQNKCVNPPGNELPSIKDIESYLTEKNVPCQVFQSAPNRANLFAKIEGTDNQSRLMFGPSHVDVVPVPDPKDWEVDAFSATIKDGHLWGRGAIDMLFIVATQVVAFAKLYEEGFKPKGDLMLLIVADEEKGSFYGTEWMLKNHSSLFGDFKNIHAVTENGGMSIAPGKILLITGEKGASWKRLTFKGKPGHGSTPFVRSDNAVYRAARAAILLSGYCDTKIPVTTEYLTYLAEGLGLGFFKRFMLTDKRMLPFTLGRFGKSDKDGDKDMGKIIHSLSRMTISPNIVEGGEKVNVIPAKAYLALDIRTLPGQDEQYVMVHLEKALGDLVDQVEITDLSAEEGGMQSLGSASPISSDFVRAMEKTVQREISRGTLVPFLGPGATDARFFRELESQAYGFALYDPETPASDYTELAHGTNERISLKTVELSTRAYYNLAREFLG